MSDLTKHTPGPWTFISHERRVVDAGNLLIATVAANNYRDEGRSNALLIASAPDMKARIDALEAALREWWLGFRPAGWTEEQHRAEPMVNMQESERALARALIGEA